MPDIVLCSVVCSHFDNVTYEKPSLDVLGWEKDGQIGLPIYPKDLYGDLTKLDMGVFKSVTMGKNVIMGRKTWESLHHKKLKGRGIHYVLTHEKKESDQEGVVYFNDIHEAAFFPNSVIIGGATLYKEYLWGEMAEYTDHVYWNRFHLYFESDDYEEHPSDAGGLYFKTMTKEGWTPVLLHGFTDVMPTMDRIYFNLASVEYDNDAGNYYKATKEIDSTKTVALVQRLVYIEKATLENHIRNHYANEIKLSLGVNIKKD